MSTNWAGYAVASPGTTYTSVTATLAAAGGQLQPGRRQLAGSAFWVGLGGYNTDSQALEQIGADSDCSGGRPSYFAWYELVPTAAVNLHLRIFPGNTITASVNAIDAGSTIELQLINRTRGTRVTSLVPTTTPDRASAAWIAEAPAECNTKGSCSAQSLANFGSVSFTRVAALGNGIGGTVADPVWSADAIELQPAPAHGGAAGAYGEETPSGSSAGASPQPPSVDGRAFTITWSADATAGAGPGSGMASSPGSTWARPRSADPEAAAG